MHMFIIHSTLQQSNIAMENSPCIYIYIDFSSYKPLCISSGMFQLTTFAEEYPILRPLVDARAPCFVSLAMESPNISDMSSYPLVI